jgi:hypothetical protein
MAFGVLGGVVKSATTGLMRGESTPIPASRPSLPGQHRYTVIYMVRPTEQVVDSQWAMLAR